jgi:hypothetical protein
MATVRHDGTTRPLVQPDGLGGHRPEVIIHSGGGGGGGGAVSIADGDDVVEGSLSDAAIVTDAPGTVSGKLRGIVAILANVWDSVNSRLRVAIHDGGNSITVDDGGGSVTVDGAVTVSGTVSVNEPVTVDGTVATTTADGANTALGTTTDPDTATTVIGRLQKIVSLLTAGLSVVISGTPTVNQGTSPWIVGDGGGSLSVDDGGGTITVDGTVATTVADGADTTLGAIADAAVTTNTTGTISGKLRGIVAILANVWDSVDAILRVKVSLPLPTGGNVIGAVDQGTSPWVVGDGGSSLTTDTNDVTATGSLTTAGDTVEIPINGQSAGTVRVSGTFTGTWLLEITINGTNWTAIRSYSLVNDLARDTVPISIPDRLIFGCGGHLKVRVRAATWSSGTGTVELRVSAGATQTALVLNDIDTIQSINAIGSLPAVITDTTSITGNSQEADHTGAGGRSGTGFNITGTWTGTLTFQASVDFFTWFTASAVNLDTGELVTSTTANGNFYMSMAGLTGVRVFSSGWVSGTAVVDSAATLFNSATCMFLPLPAGDHTIGRVKVDQSKNAVPKRYQIALNLPGTTVNTNIGGLRKQSANAVVRIKRLEVVLAHAAAGIGNPITFWRATTVAGGSAITAADVPKKDTNAADATLEVRTGAVTGTKANQAIWRTGGNQVVTTLQAGPQYVWQSADLGDDIVLRGDEGIIIDQSPLAGDADDRYLVNIFWEEE